MNITSVYKVHANKGTKEGIVRFVSARPTQKDHVTNEEVKSCNNHKIQEIIMGNHAITSCTNAHATTSHTTDTSQASSRGRSGSKWTKTLADVDNSLAACKASSLFLLHDQGVSQWSWA